MDEDFLNFSRCSGVDDGGLRRLDDEHGVFAIAQERDKDQNQNHYSGNEVAQAPAEANRKVMRVEALDDAAQRPQAGAEDPEGERPRGDECEFRKPVREDVVSKPDHGKEEQVAVEAGRKGVEGEERQTALWDYRHFHGKAKNAALKPPGKKRCRTLLQVRQADALGKEVVAVEFDERVEIDEDEGDAGEQDDLIGKVMQPLAGECV